MKVEPINNTNRYYKSNNTNFKGQFLKTRDLEYVMGLAPTGTLNEFNGILKKIKGVNDNIIFWVESHWSTVDINNGSDEKSTIGYELYKQIGQDKKTKKSLYTPNVAYDYYGDEIIEYKLAGINACLKDMYKDIFASEDSQRTEIKNEIRELLIEG